MDTEYSGGPWEWHTLVVTNPGSGEPLGVVDPGSGEPWEWRTLGVVDPGSGEPWEWWTLAVANPGSGEPWEWWTLGVANRNYLGNELNAHFVRRYRNWATQALKNLHQLTQKKIQ